MEKDFPLLLEEPEAYKGNFLWFSITIEVAPTRDIAFIHRFEVKTSSDKILLPLPGFKSEFMTVGALPFPLSVQTQRVEVNIEKAIIKQNQDRCRPKTELYRLNDGNIGVMVYLPEQYKGRRCKIQIVSRLKDFARSDPLSTELVIGIFPPWGWKKGEMRIELKGALQTVTLGQKLVAGVHDVKSGRRRRKYRPKDHIRRLIKMNNDLSWNFSVGEFEYGQEVRLRVRASRIPLMSLVAPLVFSLTFAFLIFGWIIQWIIEGIKSIIK